MNRKRRRNWAWPRELSGRGVLGINRRNLELLSPLNPRRFYPRVDDKVLTKRICEANGVPVPETYALVERYGDIRRLPEILADRAEFVVKPACGAGGRGIVAIAGRDADGFLLSGGQPLSFSGLRYHVSGILAGLHSLGGRTDRALIEERIDRHAIFEGLAVGGTPDIRVICHGGEPVMAMLRLPTNASGGRANLHQGAVGAGIDVRDGMTLGGVVNNRAVEHHPDTGARIAGHRLPDWPAILDMAARLSRALELGYVGVDLVLDTRRGPVVLEANARPGLAIQIANRCGLAQRLWRQPAPVEAPVSRGGRRSLDRRANGP
ncbi:MAG: alpha-L-glutamate ligase-like protein [Planctomycetota bacterium]